MREKRDIYQDVTDRIIEQLEQGTVPWHRPWASRPGDMPQNLTGRPYRGVNVMILALAGYSDPRWGTYKMIAAAGGQVRKGEKGTRIILWKPTKSREDANGDRTPYLLLRDYVVFNAEQADGLPERDEPLTDEAFAAIEAAEAIIEGMPHRPAIAYGGDRAYYAPYEDFVRLPEREAFESPEAFYCTAFHELTHATGHESRVGGLEPSLFGSDPYAKEELVAELGAAFLAGFAGIETRHDASAAYVQSWLKRLQNDRKLVVQAAAQAQKRADFIVGTTFDEAPAKDDSLVLAAA